MARARRTKGASCAGRGEGSSAFAFDYMGK